MDTKPDDILYQAASAWNKLTEYRYKFIYGYKNKLYHINLTFSVEDFPHLAGFQYLKDISFPRYNHRKIVSRIIDGAIKFEQIQKVYNMRLWYFQDLMP
ncbi:MAG: PBECR4 domain-containing protein [Butyrivibrio sp.]|nr:PBECR4 domain-containing protein [Butyrivibrio sp.]